MPITAEDALAPMPSWGTMVKRGLTKRCARCGSGGLFDTWWRMKAHCPRCGMRFVREEGYFTGVILINLAVTEGALLLVMVGFILALGQNGDVSVAWPLAIGGVLAVTLPVLCYPFARTTWFALDLVMRPLEMKELLEAVESSGVEAPSEPPDPPAGAEGLGETGGVGGPGANGGGAPGGNDRSDGDPPP